MANLMWGLILAFVIEAVTAFFRFGLRLQATRDTEWLAPYTFGARIHHGYIGVLLLLLIPFLGDAPFLRKFVVILGVGLAVSDLVHHFLVLWPLTGSPEFDLWYPGYGSSPR